MVSDGIVLGCEAASVALPRAEGASLWLRTCVPGVTQPILKQEPDTGESPQVARPPGSPAPFQPPPLASQDMTRCGPSRGLSPYINSRRIPWPGWA